MQLLREQLLNLHPNAIMVFGLLLLCGVAGGMVANRIKWMPTITAFMTLGIIIGPYGLGLVNKTMLSSSSVLIDIALGLILYRLGNMLHPKAMMRSRRLMLTSGMQIAITFTAVFILTKMLGYSAVLSSLIAAIAVSSSPAVLVHVSEELRAKGPITERAKSLVALNNLFSFLIFSAALPFAMITREKGLGDVLLVPVYRMAASVAIAIGVGWIAIRITRLLGKHDEHYRFAIVIGAIMLTLGLSHMLAASPLFAPLILGMATRGFETSKTNLSRVGLGEGGDLFYIILFVMAGAKIDLSALVTIGIIPFLLLLARSVGIFLGIFAAARATKVPAAQAMATSLMLVPMAGMAIGLVTTTSTLVPEMGSKIAVIVYTMVALFETIGPFAAMHALRMSGEAGKRDEETKTPPEEEL